MQPGEYEFSTGKAEIMEILSGKLELFCRECDWKLVKVANLLMFRRIRISR